MTAYSFKERFRMPILAGTKTQTIRNNRKRHARPGEEMQLYTGMRTRHCDLICKPTCKVIEPIRMQLLASMRYEVEMPSTSSFYAASALDAFARSDGFDDWPDLVAFWAKSHPGVTFYTGWRIGWHPLKGL